MKLPTVTLDPTLAASLTDPLQPYLTAGEDGSTLDIVAWSYGELGVPPVPEVRIYRHLAQSLCQQATAAGEIEVQVRRATASHVAEEFTLACPAAPVSP